MTPRQGVPYRDKKRKRDRDTELGEVAEAHGDDIAAMVARFVDSTPERRPNMGKATRLNDGKVDERGVPLSRRFGAGAIRKGATRG